MNQNHYRQLKEYCEFGELRKEMFGYNLLLLNMAVYRLGRLMVRELKIRKFLSFLVRVMEG